MQKRAFTTDRAAVTGGPYSQAVIYGELVFLSGQGPADPETNQLRLGTIQEQARLTLENVRIILREAGSSLDNILKATVFLADMADFDAFNAVYREFFSGDLPARTCVQAAGLPFGIKVEVEAIAHLGG
jgi:2-iminobutanoate/2-iminopropanoate deaminase